MNVNTLRRQASDDGSGNESDWRQWTAELDGTKEYVVEDVGRLAILGGRETIAGLDKDFQTDRVMPRRDLPAHLGRYTIPPIIIT